MSDKKVTKKPEQSLGVVANEEILNTVAKARAILFDAKTKQTSGAYVTVSTMLTELDSKLKELDGLINSLNA